MPLKGIKILDLSRNGPGPFCSMILGDYGADIIKINEPVKKALQQNAEVSEKSRPASFQNDDQLAIYNTFERNKRSITLNLKTKEGVEIFKKLAQKADVILTEFKVGTVEKLGIGYEEIVKINPKIIYCSISGYGQYGPYSKKAGHDVTYVAAAGILDQLRGRDDEPSVPLNLLADYSGGGMHAALGILLALIGRDHTGKGTYIDSSMTDGVLLTISGYLSLLWGKGFYADAVHPLLSGKAPFYNVYKTSDNKYVAVGTNEEWSWNNLCTALGCPELIPEQWNTAQWYEMRQKLGDIFSSDTQEHWCEKFDAIRTCFSRVNTPNDLIHNPHFTERGSIIQKKYPGHEPIPQVGITLQFSDYKGEIKTPPPVTGTHTDDVLRQIGYSELEIAKLRNNNVI